MKKHEMVLDFTSLLDVILIILFLVLCTMNGKAQKDADKIDDLTAQKTAYEQLVAEQEEKLAELEQKNTELEEQLNTATEDSASWSSKYAELENEIEYYKDMAKRSQEALKQYLEIGGLGQYDAKLFEFFKESSITIEINVSLLSHTNTLLTMRRDGKKVMSYDFTPGKKTKDPTFDPPDQVYYYEVLSQNKQNIIERVDRILSDLVKASDYQVLLLITYESADTYDQNGLDVVKEALDDLKNNDAKGYKLKVADWGSIK